MAYMIKDGVKLVGVTTQWGIMDREVRAVYEEIGKDCVLTSAVDGKHGRKSRHKSGNGGDYRTKHLTSAEKSFLLRTLHERLGLDFDFLLEAEGTANEHLHGEWDPK